jgi:hypothetical protein
MGIPTFFTLSSSTRFIMTSQELSWPKTHLYSHGISCVSPSKSVCRIRILLDWVGMLLVFVLLLNPKTLRIWSARACNCSLLAVLFALQVLINVSLIFYLKTFAEFCDCFLQLSVIPGRRNAIISIYQLDYSPLVV